MKAVGYCQAHALGASDTLVDIVLDKPVPMGRDLLVAVQAVSVNPVDTKVRASASADGADYKVLGWDAVGVVQQLGPDVTHFKVGDRVWYAGDISRSGSNAELQLVDERIVGLAPNTLSNAAAAALPLTSLTAWELLFDRLAVTTGGGQGKAILIMGAAGGVGSILVQLARQLTQLTVVATAGRAASVQWLQTLGAHHVIDHHQPLLAQLQSLGLPGVDYVASLTHTEDHIVSLVEALLPQGKLALIDDPELFDVKLLKRKSLSLHWEFMYTRSLYQTEDMQRQQQILQQVAQLLDQGRLQSTVNEQFGAINAANLLQAHQLLESGLARGKIVLEGF